MATNLLIGYPDIPFRATAITIITGTEDTNNPATNVINGSRGQISTITTAQTSSEWKFDLGASATSSINFGFVARASVLKAQGATSVLFKRSTDDSVYTSTLGASTTFQAKTLTGPRAEDYFVTSTFNDDIGGSATATRYWRCVISGATARKWFLSKIYTGTLFDFGRDPLYDSFSDGLQVKQQSNREPRRAFTIKWEGITTANRNSFITKIYQYREVNPVVLYDAGNGIFNGAKTMHCSLTGATFENRTVATHDITATFEELI